MKNSIKIIFISLALCFSIYLHAELPELRINDYEYWNWLISNDFYPEIIDSSTIVAYDNLSPSIWGQVSSRFLPENEEADLTHKYRFYSDRLSGELNIKQTSGKHIYPNLLYTGFLQYNKTGQNPVSQRDMQECKKNTNLNLVFGNYSLYAGNGLALGCLRRIVYSEGGVIPSAGATVVDAGMADAIYFNRNPSRYGLTGVAFQMGKVVFYSRDLGDYFKPDITVFLSSQDRQAQVEDNKIKLLYATRTDDDNRETVEETMGGFVVHNYFNAIDMGLVSYWQKYDRGFLDPNFKRVSYNSTVFGKYKSSDWSASGEVSLSQTKPSMAIEISPHFLSIYQSIGFYRITEQKPFTYSRTNQVLGQRKIVDEIDYSIQHDITGNIWVRGQIAFAKNIDPSIEQTWRDREVLALTWKDDSSKATLNWYRFSKNVIADYDSIGQDFLNIQNRFGLSYSRKIASHLTTSLECQYQHYRDVEYTKNGFMQEYGLNYSTRRFKASTRLKLWSNLKDSYQESIDDNDTEYLRVSGSDAALGINLRYKLSSYFTVSCSAYRPFSHPENQAYYFTIKADNN